MRDTDESPSSLTLRFLAGFRRITTLGDYVPEVDGVRCLAIMMVLAQHIHERVYRRVQAQYPEVEETLYHQLLSRGGVGVLIFFALSGYILHRLLSRPLLAGKPLDLRSYFWRRITRLEPPYIIVTTAIFAFVALSGYQSGGKYLGAGDVSRWASYLATIFYLHTLIYARPPGFNPPGWSLETEVQFYILAPAITIGLLALPRFYRMVAAALLVVAWVACFGRYAGINAALDYSIFRYLPLFMTGIAVCELLQATGQPGAAGRITLDVLGIGSLGALVYFIRSPIPAVPFQTFQCLLIGLILMAAFRGGYVRRFLSLPWVATVGGMCYTLYLIHSPIIELLCNRTVRWFHPASYVWMLLAQTFLILPIVMIAGAIFFRFIERPCMRKTWPQDLWAWVRNRHQRA